MASYLFVHSQAARERLAHPARSSLRKVIGEHSGPWSPEGVERLNEAAPDGLCFELKNGQLHVRCQPYT